MRWLSDGRGLPASSRAPPIGDSPTAPEINELSQDSMTESMHPHRLDCGGLVTCGQTIERNPQPLFKNTVAALYQRPHVTRYTAARQCPTFVARGGISIPHASAACRRVAWFAPRRSRIPGRLLRNHGSGAEIGGARWGQLRQSRQERIGVCQCGEIDRIFKLGKLCGMGRRQYLSSGETIALTQAGAPS